MWRPGKKGEGEKTVFRREGRAICLLAPPPPPILPAWDYTEHMQLFRRWVVGGCGVWGVRT